MTPEEYRQAQADLADKSEQTALAVAASAGLAKFSLVDALVTFLMTVKDTATMLADSYTAAALGVSPLGLTVPQGEADRLTFVLAGVLEDNRAAPLPRVGRIARSEPTDDARKTVSRALVIHDQPDIRMRWVLDPDPCPICVALAQRTYDPDELPISHPNCECTTAPVLILKKKENAA